MATPRQRRRIRRRRPHLAAEARRSCAMGCGWTREEHQEVAHDRVHLGRPRGGAGVAGVRRSGARGGGRSSGELGVGVTEHGRRSWGVLRTPEIAVSTTVGSETSCGGCDHSHAMAGGERLSATVEKKLGDERELERRGKRKRGSQWIERRGRRARGSFCDGEFTAAISGHRG